MNVEKKDLAKSQIELNIELSVDEFAPYITKGAARVAKEIKIEGFRPGKAPLDVVKRKVGEMTILEEAARLAIDKTLGEAIKEHVEGNPVGSPKVDVTKLAPDNPFVYRIVLALVPDVTLGKYKDMKVREQAVKVEDKEIEKMISDLKEMRAKEVTVLREIKEGDKALLDIQMFLDKVPVDGGQSRDTAVIVGKDFIVPGFDKQLLGVNKGESREFSLPYPKDFHMKNLAGKLVEFKVTVKDIFERQMPEIDDKFALSFGAKNKAEFEANVKKSIKEQKEMEVRQKEERDMLMKIIDKTKFGDIPEMLIESETHNMLHELEDNIQAQGGKFDDYLKSLNKTNDQLTLDLLPEAVKRVKISLLIREIAQAEKIKIEPPEIEKQLQDLKKVYKDNQDMMKQLARPEYKNYLANVMTSRKVIDKLKEWNVVKK